MFKYTQYGATQIPKPYTWYFTENNKELTPRKFGTVFIRQDSPIPARESPGSVRMG